jgi:hypothetical protein
MNTQNRESEVKKKIATLVKLGYTNRKIGDRLGVSTNTVSNWRITGKIQQYEHYNLLMKIPDTQPEMMPIASMPEPQDNQKLDSKIVLGRLEQLTRQVYLLQSDIGVLKLQSRQQEEEIARLLARIARLENEKGIPQGHLHKKGLNI